MLFELTKRDVSDRYAGQVLGGIWAVIQPVVTIGAFIFIFSTIFGLKTSGVVDPPKDHTLYMLSGLIPWFVTSDVLSRSSTIVYSQAPLVKQVVFPIELLPVKMVLASLPTFFISFFLLLLYSIFTSSATPFMLLYPISAIPLYLFLIGASLIFSSLAIFFRDVNELIKIYLLFGAYMSPIFFFKDWLPPAFRFAIYINPLTWLIQPFHDSAYYGSIQNYWIWRGAFLISILTLWAGAVIFSKLKPYFGSYL